MKTERKTSIEFLKIIAMLLICLSHVVNPLLGAYVSNGYTNTPIGLIYTSIKNFGWIGDYIFIACSGYYLVGNKKFNIRKIILYYLDVSILFLIYLGFFLLFKVEGTDEYIKPTITTKLFLNYWYIVTYLLFLILLPFVNWIIGKLPKTLHLILIICGLIFQETALIFGQLDVSIFARDVMIFITMLLIMSYGKTYGSYLVFKENDKKRNLLGLILSLAYWIIKNTILFYYPLRFIEEATDICYKYCIVYYVMGITLFLLFKDMEMKQSKFINFISSLSLIFYVAHHNKFTSLVIEEPLRNACLATNPWLGLLIFIGYGLLRFIYGLVVAAIYHFSIHKLLVMLTSIKFKKKETTTNMKHN